MPCNFPCCQGKPPAETGSQLTPQSASHIFLLQLEISEDSVSFPRQIGTFCVRTEPGERRGCAVKAHITSFSQLGLAAVRFSDADRLSVSGTHSGTYARIWW